MSVFQQTTATAAEAGQYDLVIIGSGFGSSFFLHKALRKRPGLRVLVLEWGRFNDHDWQIANHRSSDIPDTSTFTTPTPSKIWWFTIGLGGGLNCWGANSPRFHPKDFRLKTHYGVGRDWPYSYEELEPHYTEAEYLMDIAGDDAQGQVLPRSRPFPQVHHRLSTVDEATKRLMPQWHFGASSGRAVTQRERRPGCCASNRCENCPIDSKFTLENGSLATLYATPGVEVLLQARVLALETEGGRIGGVVFEHQGRQYRARGEQVVLGANAVHSAFIMLKSGMQDDFVGRGLHEKAGFSCEVMLRGMTNFDGGVRNTGVNYALYDGDFRRESGAALISSVNYWLHGMRLEKGRWQEVWPLGISVEDLPQDRNCVTADGPLPQVAHHDISDYAKRGIERAFNALPALLRGLPVEDIKFRAMRSTHGHMQGTIRMGNSPADSTLDGRQIHHRYRNLIVVGSAVFPACSAANPSLTVAATSLYAAERIF